MSELSRDENRLNQINEIYQGLGKFLVEFSRMVDAMEGGLYFTVGGNQQLLRSITIELTARPLAQAWRSVMTKATDLTEDDQRVLSGLLAEIVQLIELRNDWMHGTWFVGYGNETTTDWSEALLMRFKNTKTGVAAPAGLESLPTADYIGRVVAHASLVADAISTYGIIVTMRSRDESRTARPSDRIRIIKTAENKKKIETTNDGVSWRSSQMP